MTDKTQAPNPFSTDAMTAMAEGPAKLAQAMFAPMFTPTMNPSLFPMAGGEAVSAGFENGDDECFNDKSELPANGDGGWVKDVGSCARGGAG